MKWLLLFLCFPGMMMAQETGTIKVKAESRALVDSGTVEEQGFYLDPRRLPPRFASWQVAKIMGIQSVIELAKQEIPRTVLEGYEIIIQNTDGIRQRVVIDANNRHRQAAILQKIMPYLLEDDVVIFRKIKYEGVFDGKSIYAPGFAIEVATGKLTQYELNDFQPRNTSSKSKF